MRISLGFVAAAVADDAGGISKFGPGQCVSVQRSDHGTCVLTTDCGADTSNFEFAFLCESPEGRVQKHSFGFGGFDPKENFDTQVKCRVCRPPSLEAAIHLGAEAASEVGGADPAPTTAPAAAPAAAPGDPTAATEAPAVNAAPNKPAEAAFYGPNHCVSAYRSMQGTCVIETKCSADDIKDYNFGVTCVDEKGESARHLFGKDSFDPAEVFDTLIQCRMCLGLDASDGAIPNSKGQDAAATLVSNGGTAVDMALESRLTSLEEKVESLEAKVTNLEKPAKTASAALLRRGNPEATAIATDSPSNNALEANADDDWGY
mmetsp:Transcript_8198/g.17907  ORF Transcript_8198/g.17907 Transcript_8198/m.17907 type:complete len:318 (+) Transcript_8198:151-1104(+)